MTRKSLAAVDFAGTVRALRASSYRRLADVDEVISQDFAIIAAQQSYVLSNTPQCLRRELGLVSATAITTTPGISVLGSTLTIPGTGDLAINAIGQKLSVRAIFGLTNNSTATRVYTHVLTLAGVTLHTKAWATLINDTNVRQVKIEYDIWFTVVGAAGVARPVMTNLAYGRSNAGATDEFSQGSEYTGSATGIDTTSGMVLDLKVFTANATATQTIQGREFEVIRWPAVV